MPALALAAQLLMAGWADQRAAAEILGEAQIAEQQMAHKQRFALAALDIVAVGWAAAEMVVPEIRLYIARPDIEAQHIAGHLELEAEGSAERVRGAALLRGERPDAAAAARLDFDIAADETAGFQRAAFAALAPSQQSSTLFVAALCAAAALGE